MSGAPVIGAALIVAGIATTAPATAQQGQLPPARQTPTGGVPAPEISRDLDKLPAPVRQMRSLVLAAIRAGEAADLRRPIERNEVPPAFLKLDQERGAPAAPAMADQLIRQFRERSGDGAGRETMGRLLNALAVGYARTGAGTRQEMFVWPYLAALDPRSLTPEQQIDAYRLISHGHLVLWQETGRYPGAALGIGPDGTWHWLRWGG
jgi:hypothetical protein